MASWGVIYPLDVAKSIVQNNSTGTELKWYKVLYDIKQKYGYSAYFRGLGTVLVRAFPVNAVTFLCYEEMRKVFKI